jgi:hypothetical protein
VNDLLLDELLDIEAEWDAALTAETFRRRRMTEAPQMVGPFVWSPLTLQAVDPMRQRAALQAITLAARTVHLARLPELVWFSAETDRALACGGLMSDCWSTDAPIEASCDVDQWQICLHVDIDLSDINRPVRREIAALSLQPRMET